jgi:hypothetical protein
MTYKGICMRHKASGRYANGHKRCNRCNLFIKWNGLRCSCCSNRLRIGPRAYKYKEKLREQKLIRQAKEMK